MSPRKATTSAALKPARSMSPETRLEPEMVWGATAETWAMLLCRSRMVMFWSSCYAATLSLRIASASTTWPPTRRRAMKRMLPLVAWVKGSRSTERLIRSTIT